MSYTITHFKKLLKLVQSDDSFRELKRATRSPRFEALAWPYLSRIGSLSVEYRYQLDMSFIKLYVLNPNHCESESSWVRSLKTALGSEVESSPIQKRFRKFILSSDAKEASANLKVLVGKMGKTGVPMNYEKLYASLCYWKYPNTRKRLAEEFWS